MTRILFILTALIAGASVPPLPAVSGQAAGVVRLYNKVEPSDTAPDLVRFASVYHLLFAAAPEQVPTLRARNASIPVLLYERAQGRKRREADYAFVDRHEEWFVHDRRGSRVQKEGEFWLLDIGHPTYRAYEIDLLVRQVTASGYDGVYLDVFAPGWITNQGWSDRSGQPTRVPDDVLARWDADMLTFLQALRSKLPAGKKLIWNSLALRAEGGLRDAAWEQRALAIADGAQMDGFCYQLRRTRPWPADEWAYQLNRIARVASSGKIVMAKAPLPAEGAAGQAESRRWLTFCFATYLLAADGQNLYFYAAQGLRDAPSRDPALFNVRLGMPMSSFRQEAGVFVRDFQQGMVVVNPTPRPVTHRLEGAMASTAGQTVTVDSHSALILTKP